MTAAPLVSMVMPCFQQVAFVEEAVRSVLDQQTVAVELLVMDPGSTDGSRALLEGLKPLYGERLRLYFAPDRGQSDAINRGMALARGRILGWLNSDDRLRPGALDLVVGALVGDQPAWLYGQVGMIDENGLEIAGLISRYKTMRGRRFSFAKLLTENFISQMGVFWNRAMWEAAGGLDPDRHLDMDYDLWLRYARVAPPVVVAARLADFRVHHQAKGSRRTGEQLAAAFLTAQKHAGDLGCRGRVALLVHRLLSWRTRLLYHWLKP